MNQTKGVEQRGQQLKVQVHRDDQSLLPLLVHSFVACGRTRRPHAPAFKTLIIVTEVDT